MSFVVDASVAVKWVVPEAGSESADRLVAAGETLLAPDLMPVEAANALWKKVRQRELSRAEAGEALRLLLASGVELMASTPLLPRALALAARLGHPVYDCLYLALAERERSRLVTADDVLLRRVRGLSLHARVVDLASV
jgi:predicted nucleic acid-binding protein